MGDGFQLIYGGDGVWTNTGMKVEEDHKDHDHQLGLDGNEIGEKELTNDDGQLTDHHDHVPIPSPVFEFIISFKCQLDDELLKEGALLSFDA